MGMLKSCQLLNCIINGCESAFSVSLLLRLRLGELGDFLRRILVHPPEHVVLLKQVMNQLLVDLSIVQDSERRHNVRKVIEPGLVVMPVATTSPAAESYTTGRRVAGIACLFWQPDPVNPLD
jgi:hypothetical protein